MDNALLTVLIAMLGVIVLSKKFTDAEVAE